MSEDYKRGYRDGYRDGVSMKQLPKKNCSKCGLSIEGPMGYVCQVNGCPTFLRATF